MIKHQTYVDVILPVPIPGSFTYRVPEAIAKDIQPGMRVVVQFGKRKYYAAIVENIHTDKPEYHEIKEIEAILDKGALVNSRQFKMWKWISDYYMCTPGDVMKAALPSGFKLESQTRVISNKDFSDDKILRGEEELLVNILRSRNILSIKEVNSLVKKDNALFVIRSLLAKKAIFVEEKLIERYIPKTENYVRIPDELLDEKKLNKIFDSLEKAPKQLELLMAYLDITGVLTDKKSGEISKKELLQKTGAAAHALTSMVKKGIFLLYPMEIGRLEDTSVEISGIKELSLLQQNKYLQTREYFKDRDVVLLHGITSSGKTEIYIHLINDYIREGKQVLYLLPEIALTTQIINRLKKAFGSRVGVYHSKFNDSERVEIWNNILKKDEHSYQVILGVRSSVFLPFDDLGLVIVDEEHENTYKQFDPAPRYHARDTAIILAGIHGAKTLLGTATPSIETYYNASNSKYGLVNLSSRYKEIMLPEIRVVNTRELYRKKQMVSHFSPQLVENIKNALNNNEQVILFQNRRGFSPYLECSLCGWVPKCRHCDVSLTYHKKINRLVCHYCGYSVGIPKVCDECGNTSLLTKGFGTEKIEDEIKILFPDSRVVRMDMDSTRSRRSYNKIITEFESGNIDILVGTQMISKGLDFDNVSLVGIMNADNMLNYPDFRAYERSFQLMSQVSGRAGRKNKRGLVVIQTSDPEHPVIKAVTDNDYERMYKMQLKERKEYLYPPFSRLLKMSLKHKDRDLLDKGSEKFAMRLRQYFGARVMGPQYPVISRIQNYYVKNIIIKIERERSFLKAKAKLTDIIASFKEAGKNRSIQIITDVDPM